MKYTNILAQKFLLGLMPQKLLLLMVMLLLQLQLRAQSINATVDLSMIDGIELNADNIFNYRIDNHSGVAQQVSVQGSIHYRRSNLNFSYVYNITLQPGVNSINKSMISSPTWTFSESGLRELFLNYNKLPQGTYEYCVTVNPKQIVDGQATGNEPMSCVYQTVEDLFLINLITPENDAKIYEYNPMLSWVVNYPFANELSYKIRVAELKTGQNPQSAITRNNPMYKDDHVMTTGTIYPVAAKPLQKWQPYVWTVDAYYKGILLGGAEVWKFTIVDDSELNSLPKESYYVDIRQEHNNALYYAIGAIKLKYELDEKNEEVLQLQLFSAEGKQIKLKQNQLKVFLGDNRIEIKLKDEVLLKHLAKYTLTITNSNGAYYQLPFKYVNPDFLK